MSPQERDYTGASLNGADFHDAELAGVCFDGASLNDANFSGANLRGARLTGVQAYGAKFPGADCSGAKLNGAVLSFSDLTDAHFEDAELAKAELEAVLGARASFDRANLEGACFFGGDLRGASFRSTNLQGARMYGTDLRGADLTGADLREARVSDPKIDGTTFADTWMPDGSLAFPSPAMIASLTQDMRAQYNETGDPEYLEIAIQMLERALESAPQDAGLLHNLGSNLGDRFQRSGEIADLERAIKVTEEAVSLSPVSDPFRAGRLTNLANMRRLSWQVLGRATGLRRAVEEAAEALQLVPPGSPDRFIYLVNLALCLLARFGHERVLGDLTRSLELFQEALDRIPDGDPHRHSLVADLAGALLLRYTEIQDTGDLDRMIELTGQALKEAPEGSTSRPRLLTLQGSARALRSLAAGSTEDRRQAAESYRLVCSGALEAFPDVCLRAATAWGRWSGDGGDWDGAAEAYRYALNALQALLQKQVLLSHKEARLRQAVGLAPQAAYALAKAGDFKAAVLEMERGRALHLASVLGRERFGLKGLAKAATSSPLVYLGATRWGGLALIVNGREIRSQWLQELTEEALRQRSEAYLASLRAADISSFQSHLDELTRWLWTAAMGPLIPSLAQQGRAILIPSGLLGLLPLHAAWEPGDGQADGRHYALDDLLLTWVPTARVLLDARKPGAAGPVRPSALVVEDPLSTYAPPLPSAKVEATAAVAAFSPRVVHLRHAGATRKDVAEALPRHDVVHFACHGVASPGQPLEDGLLLAGDERLTLRDVMGLRLKARLVVLAACETALAGEDLVDEVTGLPGAFLEAGAKGIVGSLWQINSIAATNLMVRFYEQWRPDEPPPEVLRRAQLEMAHDSHPYYWAGFVYVGR